MKQLISRLHIFPFLSLFALCLSCTQSNPVSFSGSTIDRQSWVIQNPKPTPNTLTDVKYLGESEILIVEEYGTLLRSRDGGNSWKAITVFTSTPFDLEFVDRRTGWVVGSQGMISRTDDGGSLWKKQFSGVSENLYSAFFIDEDHGWVVGSGGIILRTTDGGNTWISTKVDSVRALGDVLFIDLLEGWVVGQSSYWSPGDAILHSTDGGKSWEWVDAGIPSDLGNPDPYFWDDVGVGLTGIAAKDKKTITIVGEAIQGDLIGGIIVETFDGGKTWKVTLDGGHYGDVLYVKGFSNKFIIGRSGSFRKDFASSQTEERKILSGFSLGGMDFIDGLHGCEVGWAGYILFTEDGGETWFDKQNNVRGFVNDVYFLDSLNGWMTGTRGTFKTEDGGDNWTITTNPTSQSIQFLDKNTGWISSFRSSISITIDGGNTWTTSEYPALTIMKDFVFINNMTGWVCGIPYILRTDDGGHTWTEQWWVPRNGNYVQSISFVDSLNGWAFAGYNIIMRTRDGGWNWTQQSIPGVTYFDDIYFMDTLKGWAMGASNNSYYTVDGGSAWQKATFDGDLFRITSFSFPDSLNGWAAGPSGKVYHSSDGGKTWQSQQTPAYTGFGAVCAIDSNHVWATGWYSTIVHTTTGGK